MAELKTDASNVALSNFFTHPKGGVPIQLSRAADAKMLWRSPASTLNDQQMLNSFALTVTDEGKFGDCVGWADRYGGSGLGANEGSGRAAYVNGAYVKGVGRTPLIGSFEDKWHTTGLCFVDEAMRECVFSNIFDAESTWGAANIIAVIDLGVAPELDFEPSSDYCGRRVLLVRQNVIRPAHFERAVGIVTNDSFVGETDEQRVDRNVDWGIRNIKPSFDHQYREFWMRWGEQLVYQFVHRITQTSPTTSNIALDGRLLDFGAARSIPDWGSYVPGPHRPASGTEISQLSAFLEQAAHDVFTRSSPGCNLSDVVKDIIEKVVARVNYLTIIEVLGLIGFRRATVTQWLNAEGAAERALKAIGYYVKNAQRTFSYGEVWPEDDARWDLPRVWSKNPTRGLGPLRAVAEELLACVCDEPIQDRCLFRTRSRPELAHSIINNKIRSNFNGIDYDCQSFSRFLNKTVAENRRISRIEPRFLRPIGFCVGDGGSVALFEGRDNSLWGVDEGNQQKSPVRRIAKITDQYVFFEDSNVHYGESAFSATSRLT